MQNSGRRTVTALVVDALKQLMEAMKAPINFFNRSNSITLDFK